MSIIYITILGSSPRVWGQVACISYEYPKWGIIPTRMGTSTTFNMFVSFVGDHPHAYGDKFSGVLISSSVIGSSPRVWGQGVSDTQTK